MKQQKTILVLNAGSSSQKIALFPATAESDALPAPLWEASLEWADDNGGGKRTLTVPDCADEIETLPGSTGRKQAIADAVALLWYGKAGVLPGKESITAVGHRVVHGGAQYRETTRITPEVIAAIQKLAPLAPAHNPAAVEGMEAMTALLGGDVPQFAAFDTAFHHTIPEAAAVYGGPFAWVEQGIRRYGFHGISYRYCTGRAAELLARPMTDLRLIVCHLGNGCSVAAMKNGASVDTTMGYTPMDGLVMGTRCGTVDPGVLLYLEREQNATAETLSDLLNKNSGMKGLCGTGDMREVTRAMAAGDDRARLAFDVFVYRLRSYIGAMLPALGGLDALVFTGGIGTHSAAVRAATCEGFDFAGVRLDPARNAASSKDDRDVSEPDAPVRLLVLTTQEDASIARECDALTRDAR